MTIKEAGERLGITRQGIWYYIKKGIIVPERKGWEYDISEEEYQRFKIILEVKRL